MERKVLIVEDDPTSAKVLAKISSGQGFEPSIATNGAEGIYQFIAAQDFDVVFLDIMMPEVSGHDFLKVINSLHHRGMLKVRPQVIVQTAVKDYKDLKELSENESVLAVVRKPVSKENIAELLKMVKSHPLQSAVV